MSKFEITVNGATFVIEVGDLSANPVQVVVNGEVKTVTYAKVEEAAAHQVVAAKPPEPAPAPKAEPAPKPPLAAAGTFMKAPMPGKILSIRVKPGAKVVEGDTVCTLEAMKMEMPISATVSGTVQAVHVSVGDTVAFDDALISIA